MGGRVKRIYPRPGEVPVSTTNWQWFEVECHICHEMVRLPHTKLADGWECIRCRGEKRYAKKGELKHRRTDLPGRRCKACKEWKPASEFSRDKIWLRRECKTCRAEQEKERYGEDETAKDPIMNQWFSGKWKVKAPEEA